MLRRTLLSSGFLFLYLFFAGPARGSDFIEPISGTFIQLQDWMQKLDETAWRQELDAARNVGIDTVILQWVKYDQRRFYPVHAPGADPVEFILRYAERNGMKVYVGLSFESSWWKSWDDPAYLEKAARLNVAFARKLAARYGHHASFAGWYLPHELSDTDFDADEIAELRKFFRAMSDGCKAAKKLPVAASAFFTRAIPVRSVETVYRALLDGSGLDTLIVQDGVGANNWEGGVETLAAPYIKGMLRAAWRAGVTPWVAIEVFTTVKDAAGKASRLPASTEQILDQRKVSGPLADKLVMFDFFHYMSPYRGENQKKLYETYGQEFRVGAPAKP